MHELKEKIVTAFIQFLWLVAIGIFAGLVVLAPILAIAFLYWLACVVTGAIFTWVYPLAIGLLFLVTLGLAWYEGDGM